VALAHFWGDVDEQCRLLRLGANLLIHSADISLFRKHLRAEIEAIKQAATVTRQTA
jgi:4-hydroxy-2-oxoheptanedioate aldolase